MFIWYKKSTPSAKPLPSRIFRNFIFGIIAIAAISGIIFLISNKKEIISTEEFCKLADEEGYLVQRIDENEAVATANSITTTVIQCSSAEEASDLFEQYCSEYPKEESDNTQDFDFGEAYRKYYSSGTKGIFLASQVHERVAFVTSSDVSDEETAKDLFDKMIIS